MKSGSTEARQAGILVIGKVAASIADAVALMILVRLVTQEDVGIWAGAMLVYQTFANILSGGFPKVVLYALADLGTRERRAVLTRLNRLMLGLGVVLGSGLLVAGMLASSSSMGAEPSPAQYLHLIALYPIFDLPVRMMPNLLLVEGRARASAAISFMRSLANTAALVAAPLLGFGAEGLLVAAVVVASVHFLVYLGVVQRIYRGVEAEGGRSTMELVRTAIPLGATDIINILNSRLDLWMVLAFFGTAAVAEYKVGAWQIPLVTSLAYSTGAAYLPRMTQLFSAGKAQEAIDMWRASISKLALVSVPAAAVFMVGADDFVAVAFGPEYSRASVVLRAYAFLTGLRVAAFGAVMLAAGRPSYVAYAAIFTLASNAAISFPLAYWLGFDGPALGTALAFIPTLFFYCWYIAKAARLPFRNIFPFTDVVRVIGVATVPSLVAVWLRRSLELPALAGFGLQAFVVLFGFAAMATLLRLITREDWRFVGEWASLKILR